LSKHQLIMKSIVRKRGTVANIPLLFSNCIVAGFKERQNLKQLINTIWKYAKWKGREVNLENILMHLDRLRKSTKIPVTTSRLWREI